MSHLSIVPPPFKPSGWFTPQRVDAEGVPELVQEIRFTWNMSVVVRFFNDECMEFTTDQLYYATGLCGRVGLLQRRLKRMQELEVENAINELAKTEWHKWFPHLKLVHG